MVLPGTRSPKFPYLHIVFLLALIVLQFFIMFSAIVVPLWLLAISATIYNTGTIIYLLVNLSACSHNDKTAFVVADGGE